MKTRVNKTDDLLLGRRQQLRDARTRLDEAHRRLVDEGDDKRAHEQWAAATQEIAEIETHVAFLERLKSEAAARDSDDFKRAEHERVKGVAAGIEQRMQQLEKVWSEIITLAEAFAPKLAEADRLARDNKAAVWSVVKWCRGHSDKAHNQFDSLEPAARGIAAGPSFVDALYAAGVGRVGLQLHQIDIQQTGSKTPLADAMRSDRSKLLAALTRLIEGKEAELKGRVKEAPPTQRDRFIKGGRKLERHDAPLAGQGDE